MHPIPFDRALCAGAALVCYAAAFVLTPSTVRSQITMPIVSAPPVAPLRVAPIAPVPPQRDAFASRAHVDDAQSDLQPSPPGLVAVPHELAPHGGDPLRDTVHVTAIATGIESSAIVEIGGVSRVVAAGDVLAGARIQRIGHNDVELDNGQRFALASSPTSP